jgi:hypothetical protein
VEPALHFRKVDMCLIQFNFSNLRAVPDGLREIEPEDPEEMAERKGRANGKEIFQEGSCSIESVPGYLEANGYFLADAFFQRRFSLNNGKKIPYFTVRFTFQPVPSKEFKEDDKAKAALKEMCRTAAWKLKIFRNPLFRNGEKVKGRSTLCLKLVGRETLVQFDGRPILEWAGNPIGKFPVPRKAKTVFDLSQVVA